MSLSAWAARHFYLSAESSYVEGRWRAYPYQTAIMDAISNDDIREVDWMKSARVGYTKIILAAIGYYTEHHRRNTAIWQPVDEDSDNFVKTELEPMLRDVPAMEAVFPQSMAKHKHNTLKQKVFLGSTLHMLGGKAAKNYRRITVDCAFLDELDGFDADIEQEGSPVTLAGKRIEGATFPKLVLGSTPKLRGFSMIEARADQASAMFRYHVACPHCGAEIALTWGGPDTPHGFKWRDGDPDTVAHLCGECSAPKTQADYLAAWDSGRWIAPGGLWIDPDGVFRTADDQATTPPQHVAFHIWTAYSPQASWAQIVREFLAAKAKAERGDKSELKSWVNTTLGETWEEDIDQADQHELARRAEDYRLRTCCERVLVLVAGVDVQDNRFEIVVWGIGRGEEMWVVDYTALSANPADERDWQKLDTYLQTRFPHAAGQPLGIEAVAVDTGGHFTHQVYSYCRTRAQRRVFAIKGEGRPGLPIKGRASRQDVNVRGKILRHGVKLWAVGVDTAKDLLFGRLQVDAPGPGYVHFSTDLAPDFYAQLTSEGRVLQRTSVGEVYRWIPRAGARNEVLDCTVYALFCAQALDLHRYTEPMWRRLEDAVAPRHGDLFAAEPKAPEPPRKAEAAPLPPPRAPETEAPQRRRMMIR